MNYKKGQTARVEYMIGVVILLILVASLAPVALSGLFNQNINGSLTCHVFNDTSGTCLQTTNVPSWVVASLGVLGAVAFVYIIWRSANK